MIYFLGYLTLGMVLVVLKSPIRKMVDWEVADLKMHCLIKDEDIHNAKLFFYRLILSFIIIVIYPVILFRKVVALYKEILHNRDLYCEPPESEPGWLRGEISIEDAEAEHMVTMDGHDVPFGYNNDQWRTILKIIEDGDKLYEFRSPEKSWRKFAGTEGVALVRNGEIVADIVILLHQR